MGLVNARCSSAAGFLLSGALALLSCSRSSRPLETEDASTAAAANMRAQSQQQLVSSAKVSAAGASDDFRYLPQQSAALSQAIARVRLEDYATADELLGKLVGREQALPEVRYLRAKVKKGLEQCEQVLPLLVELDGKLGVLDEDLPRFRAYCELGVGPFDKAAQYFSASSDPRDWLSAAVAEERAGKLEVARKLTDKILLKLPKGAKELEFQTRVVRARLAEAQKLSPLAATELRWLATMHPTRAETATAPARLAALSKYPLTSKERLTRAKAFSQAGQVEACEQELALVPQASAKKGERQSLLGWANYTSRKDYLKAAELLSSAARKGSRDPVMDLFYAARALSRGDDDEHALRKYAEVAQLYPKTVWADHSRYQRARLLFILGRWKESEAAYLDYQKRLGKAARHKSDVQRELAVLWLILGKSKLAAPAFGNLAKQAKASPMYQEGQAVALELGGQRAEASKLYREIIEREPLSLAAQLSRLRLSALGENVPAFPALVPKLRPARLKPKLPHKVLALLALGLDREAEKVLKEREVDLAQEFPTRKAEALCAAYGELATAERRFQLGMNNAKPGAFDALPAPEAEWLWECAYPQPYAEHVQQSSTAQVSSALLFGLMRQESGFRVQVQSAAAARGLMQIIDPTAQRIAQDLGLDPHSVKLDRPHINVRFGAHYLDKLVSTFQGSVPLALAAYNAGPPAVARWLEKGHGLPLDLFVASIPYEETRGYVERVMSNWLHYAYLSGDSSGLSRVSLKLPQAVKLGPDAY